jgi:hypothetical protein
MSWQPDPRFFTVPQHTVRVSSGEVEFPLFYTDATCTSVFYAANLRVATALLRPHGVSPARVSGGRALLGITWFEYRATSIGPYNELGISVLASSGVERTPRLPLMRVLAGDPRLAFFVLHLPVTTEIARVGGVEVYGFPKTLNELPIEWDEDRLTAALFDQGRAVFEMNVPLGRGVSVGLMDLPTYSTLDGHLMRTVVATDCRARLFRSPRATLVTMQPEHPIARTLAALEPDRRPRAVLHVPKLRSRLPLPVPAP